MARAGTGIQDLRALRYNPPGYAQQGARRTTFQSALEQCEQFLTAARDAGYATRPVQMFYALSQASRAIVAASPRIGNQAWGAHGHGLTAKAGQNVAETTVTPASAGLFPSVAAALGAEPLPAQRPVALRDLWPLLLEAAFPPLTGDAMLPLLMFFPSRHGLSAAFSQAEIAWVPERVRELCGGDPERVKKHLDQYPALRESKPQAEQPASSISWKAAGPGLTLTVEWRDTAMRPVARTIGDVGVVSYRSADDFVITPAIGSMSTGLHPLLALWAVLLGLSSLARYEPATWSKIINIDRSAEANSIEHLLDEGIRTIPAVTFHLLTGMR
jgi:hypothetical protein